MNCCLNATSTKLDSHFITGSYCKPTDGVCKPVYDQSSPHQVIWTVGDRLQFTQTMRTGANLTDNENPLIDGSINTFYGIESKPDYGTSNFEKQGNEPEKVLILNLERERILAVAKLQEVKLSVSQALTEATDVREQALKARREALAARRESVDAQTEAMKAKKDSLQAKRDIAEAKRTLAEVIKAITAIQHEVQHVPTAALKKMNEHIVQKTFIEAGDENLHSVKQDENEEWKRTKKRRKKLPLDKINEEHKEQEEEDLFDLAPDCISDSESTSTVEPRVIITDSHTMKLKQGDVGDILAKNNSFNDLPYGRRKLIHQQQTLENIEPSLSEAHKQKIQDSALIDVHVKASDEDPAQKKISSVSGAKNVVDDVTEIVEDFTSTKEGSSDEEDQDKPGSKIKKGWFQRFRKKRSKNTKAEAESPNTGSFVQKWGDFIGRISTLMITIVTAVNTAEALIDALMAASFVKAGTFAFLLICIHIPVAAVMTWLLLREKVQQIKDIIAKTKRIKTLIIKIYNRIAEAAKSRRNNLLEGEELREATQVTEREVGSAAPSDNTSSIFIIEPQESQGVVNEAFTEDSQNGCNPISM